MSSSSVRALPELPGVPSARPSPSWPDFSFEEVLPRPELMLLSAPLLLCDVSRLGRLAKLLLYLLGGAGFGDAELGDTTAISVAEGGARSCCWGRALRDVRLLALPDVLRFVRRPPPSYLPAEVPGEGVGRGEEASEPDLNGGFWRKLIDGRRDDAAAASSLIRSPLSISSESSSSS